MRISFRGDSTTLARPISSQGREKPTQSNPDDTMSSGYGAIGDNPVCFFFNTECLYVCFSL